MTESGIQAATEYQKDTASLEELARGAAELLHRTIKTTNPEKLDFKDVKQLTGALKDLAELMDEKGGDEESGGIVIRIEGDPGQ